MRVSGTIVGDQFPCVETFIIDKNDKTVMLGVWQIPDGAGPVLNESYGRGITGDKQLPMIDFDFIITVENDIFTEIIKDGREMSIDEHNSFYMNLPPIKS